MSLLIKIRSFQSTNQTILYKHLKIMNKLSKTLNNKKSLFNNCSIKINTKKKKKKYTNPKAINYSATLPINTNKYSSTKNCKSNPLTSKYSHRINQSITSPYSIIFQLLYITILTTKMDIFSINFKNK